VAKLFKCCTIYKVYLYGGHSSYPTREAILLWVPPKSGVSARVTVLTAEEAYCPSALAAQLGGKS